MKQKANEKKNDLMKKGIWKEWGEKCAKFISTAVEIYRALRGRRKKKNMCLPRDKL